MKLTRRIDGTPPRFPGPAAPPSGRATVLAVLAAALVVGSGSTAWSRTLVVGTDAPTLPATLEAASDGDTIVVPEGVWAGPVRIERTVTVVGPGTIDGGGVGSAVEVAAPGVVLRALRVRNSGVDVGASDACIYTEPTAVGTVIEDNDLSACAFGIWVHTTEGVSILDNRVHGRAELRTTDRGNGIHLFDASRLTVRGNEIADVRDGLYVSATDDSLIEGNTATGVRFGIHYMYSNRNTVRGNTCVGNTVGLALMESRNLVVEDNVARDNERDGLLFRDATECEIRRNRLVGNGQGMFFFSSTENVIADNVVEGNDIGMKVWAGSVRNTVSGNVFVGNGVQVFYVGADDLEWGTADGGNYWSDYVGWDQDGDGIGDRPYRTDSFAANLTWRYPSAVLLLRSPTVELLAHMQERLPVFRVPAVVDRSPLMGPQ